MPVNTRLQVRRGNASLWTSTNPTLSAGEIGFELDTGLFKVGDGLSPWTSLKYAALPQIGNNSIPYFGSGVYVSLAQGSGVSLTYNSGTGVTTIDLSNPTLQLDDITDLSTDARNFLLTPTSFNLNTLVTDNTGSGLLVFNSGATLVNPTFSGNITIGPDSLSEVIEDTIGNKVKSGANISVTYNDGTGETTIAATGVSLAGHTHVLSNITDVSASATEVNYLSGVILGTGVASRAVILDSTRSIYNLGNVSTTGTLTVGGNLVINGTTTTVNSTTTTLDDPIITLGGDTAPTGTDAKDRGVEFRYWDDSTNTAKIGFFGYDDSTGKFTFLTSATNNSEAFTGTTGTLDANIEWSSVLNKPDPVVTVNLTGEVTGSGSATLTDLTNGTINISTTVASNTVTLGTDTIGQYASTISVAGTGLSATTANADDGTAYTISSNATPANVANTLVSRNSNGDFSAGTITASQFVGGGSGITNINASNISTGTLASGLLPNVLVGSTSTGPASSFVSSVTTDDKGRVTSINTTTHILATTGVAGIASFDNGDFSVAAGVVSIKASGIGNSQLENNRVTIGQTPLVLGSTYSAISGISSANPVILTYFAIDGGSP